MMYIEEHSRQKVSVCKNIRGDRKISKLERFICQQIYERRDDEKVSLPGCTCTIHEAALHQNRSGVPEGNLGHSRQAWQEPGTITGCTSGSVRMLI